jgi:anti-sigma regulatory factor (Ser/Thr protein kinase)
LVEPLSYDLLDDLCLLLQDAGTVPTGLPVITARTLGPVLELSHAYPQAFEELCRTGVLQIGRYAPLLEGGEIMTSRKGEFIVGRCSIQQVVSNQLAETELAIHVKNGTSLAGFASHYGSQIVAAIREFYSNVVEHSENIQTGYIAFAAQPNAFEFVVADKGIGVLRSLVRNPKYSDVKDAGRAIELAISEGVSSSTEPGHGNGFRPVFVGLANISDLLRFRSGDHGHQVDREPDGEINVQTRQLAELRGFFCSVACSTK